MEHGATVEAMANLARMTVPLHASRDVAELAGHFEHLAERCLDSRLSLLILNQEESGLRVINGSLRRPPAAQALRVQLGVQRLSENQNLAEACRMVARVGSAQWLSVCELFTSTPAGIADGQCLITPLSFAGEALGVAFILTRETAQASALASVLADHTAVALQRLNAYETARRLHGLDAAFWIADADAVRHDLAKELSRARRYGGSVGLTVIRLDYVSALRERYGTFYTDHMVRRVGGHLRTVIRDTDALGSLFGGFAIIHPGANREGARIAADRLTDSIGTFVSTNHPELELSLLSNVSVAAAASPDDGASADDLIAAVERELPPEEQSRAA